MKGGNIRVTILVLCAFCTALFFAGCPDPVSLSTGTAQGPHILVALTAGEPAAQVRTALPSAPSSATYTISVSRSGTPQGSLSGVPGSGPFLVPLISAPAVGDTVKV